MPRHKNQLPDETACNSHRDSDSKSFPAHCARAIARERGWPPPPLGRGPCTSGLNQDGDGGPPKIPTVLGS